MTTYFKPNKVQTLEIITPKFYLDDDISLSGLQIRLEDQLVNSHLILANNIQSVLNISGLTTLSSIAPYFVKQNNLTRVTPFNFETNILLPLGREFSEFSTSAEFASYISGTLLPSIRLNSPTAYTHSSLITNLGWFYFLNTSATPYSPSSYVAEKLVDLFYGNTLELVDGIKGFETLLWKNYYTSSTLQNLGAIPSQYLSGTGVYTSGTQQLDKLLTLVDVVYSPLISDQEDFAVRDAFNDYIDDSLLLSDVESKGAFYKYLKAVSYGMHDIDDGIQQLNALYDLEKCPDRFLPLIAELIGWHLFGYDPVRWRLQLKNAVSIYKAKGTKRALQAAIDSIFTEGFLNLSGDINELYESYIPNLIYYVLATESPLFEDFSTWTNAIANSLGVQDYSNQSFDTNIRYAVDYILRDVVYRYNSYFTLNKVPWNLNDPNFIFNYRGRNFNIPPFEEVKYYKDTQLSEDIIDFIADRVACFGISSNVIEPFKDFIKGYTVDSSSLLHLDNRWLFFYSGLQLPSNYDSLLQNYQRNKFDYVGLWSGKSSHFNLNILASSYTYSDRSVNASSTFVLQEALKAINAFSPAHAIPKINFFLDNTDVVNYDENSCETINYPQIDYFTGSAFMQGYEISGINMSSLGKIFKRAETDDLLDFSFSSTQGLSTLPRRSQRRRSLKGILPQNIFDKTGYNMPVPILASTLEYSARNLGMLPLGFIPSALKYVPVTNASSIPAIYGMCETLSSSSVYSGVAVSATFPCKGLIAPSFSSCTIFTKKGDTNYIYGLINKILYNREKEYWKSIILTSSGYQALAYNKSHLDLSTSLANSSFTLSSFSKYEDFAFGLGIHKIYNDWVKIFGKATINNTSLNLSGGKDIFSHTYGPVIYNARLDRFGSAINVSANLVASSYTSIVPIDYAVLNPSTASIGTTTVSSNSTLNFGNEFRNAHILNNVELVITSGSNTNNQFVLFNINPIYLSPGYTNYFVENPVVKVKAIDGFPRMIYHLSANSNILSPEHDFQLKVKYFAGLDSGNKYGGAGIGVWIHTEPENGLIWSYNTDKKWELFQIPSSLQITDITQFIHTNSVPLTTVPPNLVSGYAGQCYNISNQEAASLTMENIGSSLLTDFIFNFSTSNYNIEVPQSYFIYQKQVHRTNQNYVIEIFKLVDGNTNSYVLFDELNLIDMTNNIRAYEYTPKDLLYALNFMDSISKSRASRLASVTSSYYGTSGGSRINYRIHPDWALSATATGGKNTFSQVSSMEFRN